MSNRPEWITTLADEVAANIQPIGTMAPLGCHVHHNEEDAVWEITVFPSATEVIGGPHDGRTFASRFVVDVSQLMQVFSRVNAINWQAQHCGSDDDLGPHLAIDGDYQGHVVVVRVPSKAPACFEPGRKLYVNRERWVETW